MRFEEVLNDFESLRGCWFYGVQTCIAIVGVKTQSQSVDVDLGCLYYMVMCRYRFRTKGRYGLVMT